MNTPTKTQLVMTIIGPDRPGIVDAISKEVASHEGNWLESRMAQLASHFAGILLVEVPLNRVDALSAKLSSLSDMRVQVTVARSGSSAGIQAAPRARLELTGIDQPGIVQAITAALAERGVNIDTLETEVAAAPMSGEPTFTARASLQIPSGVTPTDLSDALEEIGSHLMVDIALEEV